MKVRLQQFLAAENITQAQFAESVGVASASVSHILAGRNKPGYDFIVGTMSSYPKLNIEWLLSGKGKMYKDSPLTETKTAMKAASEDNLFTLDTAPQDSQSPAVQAVTEPTLDTAPLPVPGPTTPAARERKIAKIVVFYSDNSFEEIH